MESPLFRGCALPDAGCAPMMNTRRERAAISAMLELRRIGANPLPVHRLPNGLGFIAPDTGAVHGPFRGVGCTPVERRHEAAR